MCRKWRASWRQRWTTWEVRRKNYRLHHRHLYDCDRLYFWRWAIINLWSITIRWTRIRCGSCHLDRALNVEIIERFPLLCFLCCCEMYLEALSRYRKGWVISLKNLQSNSSFFSINQKTKNKKVNKHINIQHQFQNSTTCPNDMNHTLVNTCKDKDGNKLCLCNTELCNQQSDQSPAVQHVSNWVFISLALFALMRI